MNCSMLHALKLHPDFQCAVVSHITVDVARAKSSLVLRYIVTGNISALRIPARAQPARTDELWKHTCFELFVRRRPSPAPPHKGGAKSKDDQGEGPSRAQGREYFEFNLSPSTQWAAYSFTDYRNGMAPLEDIAPPKIETNANNSTLELSAMIDVRNLSGALSLGLSAVIEETSGARSYWALRHPKGKADFHHSDCFALTL